MKNSWLYIFLNCNLLIVGSFLSSQETSLRWLLVKREQLFKENSLKRRKTCYVVNKEFDCFSKPKEFYFDSLNISRLTINNSKDLYADWSVGWWCQPWEHRTYIVSRILTFRNDPLIAEPPILFCLGTPYFGEESLGIPLVDDDFQLIECDIELDVST